MIVVFDLDGTLCDNSKREHIAKRAAAAANIGDVLEGPIWEEFHSHIPDDKPIKPVAETLDALARMGHNIEIWTARPAKYLSLTRNWLHDNELSYDMLLMRPEGDWRKSYILKLDWFLGRTADMRPAMVFEDHPETTRLLRLAGAVVAQVGEGH